MALILLVVKTTTDWRVVSVVYSLFVSLSYLYIVKVSSSESRCADEDVIMSLYNLY